VSAETPVASSPEPFEEEVVCLRLLLAERDKSITEREKRIAEFEQLVATLQKELAELKAKLGQDSSNSSRPPSSDPPWVKPKPSKKKRSGRKAGGQRGHKGVHRTLLPLEAVDKVERHEPRACQHCAEQFDGTEEEVGEPERWQVTELPPVRAEVTEHQGIGRRCCRCGRVTHGHIPPHLKTSAFGPRAQATIACLGGRYRLSRREVSEISEDVLGMPISVGSVQECCERTSEAVAEPVTEVEGVVREASIAHADETGWKQAGKRFWLWVVVTLHATVFKLAASRGSKVIQEMLGTAFHGILVTDRYSAYRTLTGIVRQLCWAHLKRDFQGLVDGGGAAQPIGEWALREYQRLFAVWHAFSNGELSWENLQASLPPVKARFRRLLQLGLERLETGKGHGLCKNLLKDWPSLWTFTEIQGIEPTNNTSERALRAAVLWRRICQGTRSALGSLFVQRMLTVAATCRQHNRPLLEYLVEVCRAARLGQTPPSMLPPPAPVVALPATPHPAPELAATG
jgi:transposase